MGNFLRKTSSMLAMGLIVVWSAIWFILIVAKQQDAIDKGVQSTHDWLGFLAKTGYRLTGDNWITWYLANWNGRIRGHIQIKDVLDLPVGDLIQVWWVWAVTVLVAWLVWITLTGILAAVGVITRRSSGGAEGGRGASGGGATITADNARSILIHHLRVPLTLGALLLLTIFLVPSAINVIWGQVDRYNVQQTYQERVNTESLSCVPDNGNVLAYDDVDQCVGILNGSSASEATKQSLTMVLSATCYAFDAYASTPQSTPTWRDDEPEWREPSAYAAKAQWMADQGVPCSLQGAGEGQSNPGILAWLNSILIYAIFSAIFAALTLKMWPLEDAITGNPVPFTDVRTLMGLVKRTAAFTVVITVVMLVSVYMF